MNELNQVVIVVPAYQPAEPFDRLIQELRQAGFERILVINDGSASETRSRFLKAKDLGATVVEHTINQGKGRALKTAFREILNQYPDAIGLVTCDADGQHLVPDILAVTRVFLRNQSSLLLGARQFKSVAIPFRSRFGNELTKIIFRILIGKKLTDTQTGLRAIPRSFLKPLLELKTGKYDFELDMLIHAFQSHVQIQEVPIAAVYSENNEHSHFNPVVDSLRIYFVFARFLMASGLSALIDFGVFSATHYFTGHLLGSMALARLSAGMINFFVGKKFTFKSPGPIAIEFFKYWLLVIVYLFISFSLVQSLSSSVSMNIYIAKLASEGVIFIFSFLVQRAYIFNSSEVPVVEPGVQPVILSERSPGAPPPSTP